MSEVELSAVTLDSLADIAERAAREAGRLVLDHWSPNGLRADLAGSLEAKSSHTDPVTVVDKASEALIASAVTRERPDDAILGEEGASRDGTTGLTWVIDPLDGTVNFVYGIPVFAVSIACTTSEPVVGVVHDPVRDETFVAVRGRGAALNGARLEMGRGPGLSEALVGTGFSYDSRRRQAQADLLAHVLPSVRDLRRAGAAALDLCWLAAGRLDAFYEAGLQPWDVAAGSLVVTEAGGRTRRLNGLVAGESELETFVAAPAPLIDDICRRLAEGRDGVLSDP